MNESAGDGADNKKGPVTLHVGYGWPTTDHALVKPEDPVWSFIRKLINTTVDALTANQIARGNKTFSCRVNRLRAMHGGSVLDILLQRIERADILVFDITGLRPNVLVEIGMALALKGCSGRVFIFQKVDARGKPIKHAKTPSDLCGYFFTRYCNSQEPGRRGSQLQLVEPRAFTSTLRTRITEVARERGAWIEASGLVNDEESCSDLALAKSKASRAVSSRKSPKLPRRPARKAARRRPAI